MKFITRYKSVRDKFTIAFSFYHANLSRDKSIRNNDFCKFNLKAAYEADAALKKWFRQIFILALIPLESVHDYWINTIEGSFPQKYWNHFLTLSNRTNNHVEGFNLKLKSLLELNLRIFLRQ